MARESSTYAQAYYTSLLCYFGYPVASSPPLYHTAALSGWHSPVLSLFSFTFTKKYPTMTCVSEGVQLIEL